MTRHRSGNLLVGMLLVALLGLTGCSTSPPDGITPVAPFEIERYLGKWYEIARLDHRFERGLSNVTATYSQWPDGEVKVINRGYNDNKGEYEEAEGEAQFIGSENVGSLKVSFFGPFAGGYHLVALDQVNYSWALVAGADRDYLWILSRDKQLDPKIQEYLVRQAALLGFDVSELIWVRQDRDDA